MTRTCLCWCSAFALLLSACGSSGPAAPFVSFTTFQTASLVLGQADFTSGAENRGGAVGASTVSLPLANAFVSGGRLFLNDYGNNRILVFTGQ